MLFDYSTVKLYFDLGLFTKQDVKDFVTVGFFAQSDYDKMFPEGQAITNEVFHLSILVLMDTRLFIVNNYVVVGGMEKGIIDVQ